MHILPGIEEEVHAMTGSARRRVASWSPSCLRLRLGLRSSGLPLLLLALAGLIGLGGGCMNKSVGSSTDANAGPLPPEYWLDGGLTWDAPIDIVGDPGWHDSDEPWDPGDMDTRESFSVWSHESGVYALVDGTAPVTNGMDRYRVLIHNDGTGWSEFVGGRPGLNDGNISRIRGFPDGSLIGYGGAVFPISQGTVEAAATSTNVKHVFVVSQTLAYAAAGEKILIYDGDHWEPITQAPPHDIYQVWATEEIVWGVGDIGTIVSYDGTDWTIHDGDTDADLRSIWGNAADDIWAGSTMGEIFHYDGQQWTEITWSNPQAGSFPDPIVGIWGDSQTVYFHTRSMLLKALGDSIVVIGDWRCDPALRNPCPWQLEINDMWGNSASELFLAVREDLSIGNAGYDGVYILWYDGAQLHAF